MAYAIDKQKAEADGWRIPENTLHTLELLGGWPGGIVAQKQLRHKNRKFVYQMVFRAIVGAHLFLFMLWLVIIL